MTDAELGQKLLIAAGAYVNAATAEGQFLQDRILNTLGLHVDDLDEESHTKRAAYLAPLGAVMREILREVACEMVPLPALPTVADVIKALAEHDTTFKAEILESLRRGRSG